MTFKKYLRKNCKAQAALEYFILFAVIALMTLLSLTTFHNDMISLTQGDVNKQGHVTKKGFFQAVVGKDGINVENTW